MSIEFTDAEIGSLAVELNLDLRGQEKIDVLRAFESCDIQAGPGTGKTTMLTAKLALLARKWPRADCGILVLSHTNAARREIERRLSQSKSLRQLLTYPHFVGTFQAFVDRFLALPYLRQKAIEMTAVDDDTFAARATSLFDSGACPVARASLEKRYESHPKRSREVLGTLRFDGVNLRITHSAERERRFPGSDSKTGKELAALKKDLAKQGYFRFEDMYAVGERCLFKRPYLASLLRQRFPWVFVDELQDTSDSQDRIVEALFSGPESVLQRFGDKNQGIFDFDDAAVIQPQLFGRRRTLPLSSTYRFGKEIARFATALTAVEPQVLNGLETKPSRKHTVFVFARDQARNVVGAFGNLVSAEVPVELRTSRSVCVIGSRKNPGSATQEHFPLSLHDYWSEFQSDLSRKPAASDSFLAYVARARNDQLKERSFAKSATDLVGGLLEMIRRASPDGKTTATTRSGLRDFLCQKGCWLELKNQFWMLLRPDVALTEERWDKAVNEISVVLAPLMYDASAPAAKLFVKWSAVIESNPSCTGTVGSVTSNILVHQTASDPVNLRFESIHAVKGETHAATLIVETYVNRAHDLKSLLPVLCGTKSATNLTESEIGHCKRLFVGITRSSELVCLAVCADHVQPDELTLLRDLGWNVVEMR